ncbi:uncharacterized protein MONOS_6960 [Monocercomonoides exilis]|uniref:uncharacterized protein n=1 Tax=Monocercomonoides exilis TaxID=2049356 RepID=UPI003559D091|nr:hypothetical protein MONOS_6960 [Monocercomonoides exilis]|eukprot:MONOS_6960.1-p1 / transcript=MONOS_6960.1 / gene=MONOS_6960 / organism=Monocercomonoides_exilis_PA203 / gene_product=unspecified product / transcript_product=unspecified product / location=Mono_scaffold00229:11742-13085(-) / protein_length=448 / sequence_SO=supercontig / SO=protein_coding / is_pseudo=false
MIEFNEGSLVSATSFVMADVMFSGNKASVGRDVYFVCGSLVAFVKEPLFGFMRNITQKDNSIVGHDRTDAFGDWDVDLFIFIDGYKADLVYVDGTSGVEEKYCGPEKAPCLNVNYGMEHLKRTQNVKEEIVVCSNSSVMGCVDVSGVTMKSNNANSVDVECKKEITGCEICVLKSTTATNINCIEFAIPTRFEKTVICVIEFLGNALSITNCSLKKSSIYQMPPISEKNTDSSEYEFGFLSIEKGTLKMEKFETKGEFEFGEFSLIELGDNLESAVFVSCIIKRITKNNGEGGWIKGHLGSDIQSMDASIVIEGCIAEKCFSFDIDKNGGKGGGLYVELNEKCDLIINETSKFRGCVAGCKNTEDENTKGAGGGIMIMMNSMESSFSINSNEIFSSEMPNRACHGKNIFVFAYDLPSIINGSSIGFDPELGVFAADFNELSGVESEM